MTRRLRADRASIAATWIHVLGLSLVTVFLGCTREPEDKITRWASEVSPHHTRHAPVPDPLAVPVPERVQVDPAAQGESLTQDTEPTPLRACHQVVARACETLGLHSDECHEARELIPEPQPPATRAACAEVLETERDLMKRGALDPSENPCHLMVRRTCKRSGYGSEACVDAKTASKFLTNAHRLEVCIGQLLLESLREALSPSGNE